MRTFYDTSSLPFRAAIKVKPLARVWDADLSTWLVKARITTRIDYFRRKCGDVVYSRPNELYAYQGVRRGTCGKLYWQDRMTDAEFLSLDIEGATE